jgi:hypothetical protein
MKPADHQHRCLLGTCRQRPHCCTAQNTKKFPPLHARPPSSGDGILSAQARTLIGAETGIKTIAAAHSQCRLWVISDQTIQRQGRPLSVVSPIATEFCGAAKRRCVPTATDAPQQTRTLSIVEKVGLPEQVSGGQTRQSAVVLLLMIDRDVHNHIGGPSPSLP